MNIINIELFFIISTRQFNEIISMLGINLNMNDTNYMTSYIMINIFAYFIIFIMLFIINKLYRIFFRNGVIRGLFG